MIGRRLTRVGRVLRDARRLIEKEGWSQALGDGTPCTGPCAAHAIVRAARKQGEGLSDIAMARFANVNALPLRRPDYSPTQRTTSWNDTRGRTLQEVLGAFRRAERAETTW